ncbi:MAG: adenylosuccinate lyase [Fimbriimonadaceae bacterium]|nr:adenylosuccinate lyase [Fimbriimonadaceae bacterium]
MIERYTTAGMTAIWSRDAKYRRWLEVEIAVCEAWALAGVIPHDDLAKIRAGARFDLERCDEIEAVTRHDLVAFVRNLSENVSGVDALSPDLERLENDASRWIHFGVTSYDIIDTALATMLRDSCDVLAESLAVLMAQVATLFEKEGARPCIGRTHGVHAEAITFGHKVQGWWLELQRSVDRIAQGKEEVSVGKVSGAVGIHAHADCEIEAMVCERLGVRPDPNSTQIVARDRHAHLLCTLGVLAGSLERIATELRNLQRTEIMEVQEEFAPGQTGSSAMPHKRNPWNAETVCGLARVVRGNVHAMLETVTTWHERDLTNSSLERIVLPDTFQLVDFMVRRLAKILTGLTVMHGNMETNLKLMGDLPFSEHLMMELVRCGLSREGAYKAAQRAAARSWAGEDFRAAALDDPVVASRIAPARLDEILRLEHHLRNAPSNLAPGMG